MTKEFAAFKKECAWQGASSPKAMEKRMRDFAKQHAGQTRHVVLKPEDVTLRIHCGLGGRCDEKADYRMLVGRTPQLHLQVFFAPTIVGREATADVAAAFQYADFNIMFPELHSATWKARGDSFKFLARAGDPRIRTLTYRDGRLHLVMVSEVTEIQAESTTDRCRVTTGPKACLFRVPASIPVEIDVEVPIETGTLDCKDKTTPDRAYRCG